MHGRGVFISINGFSPGSVQALTTGKAIQTILVDGGDLVPITEGMYTLKEMLDNKIKAVQTMGRLYVDVNYINYYHIQNFLLENKNQYQSDLIIANPAFNWLYIEI